eukprot:sb/3469143/
MNWDITEPHCAVGCQRQSKQPIRVCSLGHVTGYKPIRDQHSLVRSVPGWHAIYGHIKKCLRPAVNDKTILTPDQPEYDCGDTLTITCTECWDKDTPKQIVKCESDGSSLFKNDAGWNTEKIEQCQEVECRDPTPPKIDDRNGVPDSVDLSWVVTPWSKKCGDKVRYECDICYARDGGEAECKEEGSLIGYWDPGSRCRLRYCGITPPDKSKYPLAITGITGPTKRPCNRTIDYVCQPE